jgi:hypothetical protein
VSAETQVQIQVGYPDFWRVIFQKHEKFFSLTQSVGPTIDESFGVGMSEPMHKVCRHLAKMVSNSLGAVLLLGLNGYGIDGIKIARSMFEAAVTVAYLRKHPKEFDDYFDFHFLVGMKRHRYMEKYAPEHLKRVTPKTVAEYKEGYARVVPRFTVKDRVRGRWSKKSFSQICADLGIAEHYLSFYAFSSDIIHANISGVMAQADREPGVLDVDIAPSEGFVEMALHTAHFAFVLAASEYIAMARPEKQAIADSLNNGFVMAWGKNGH